MQAPAKAPGFICPLHDTLHLTVPDIYFSVRSNKNLSSPFPIYPLLPPFSGHSRWVQVPCSPTGVTLCKQINCVVFQSPSKTQQFKLSQLKTCLSPLQASFQLPQATIPTRFVVFCFVFFHDSLMRWEWLFLCIRSQYQEEQNLKAQELFR